MSEKLAGASCAERDIVDVGFLRFFCESCMYGHDNVKAINDLVFEHDACRHAGISILRDEIDLLRSLACRSPQAKRCSPAWSFHRG